MTVTIDPNNPTPARPPNAQEEAATIFCDEALTMLIKTVDSGRFAHPSARVVALRSSLLTLMAPLLDRYNAARGTGTITGPVGG